MNLRVALLRCSFEPREEDQDSVEWAASEVEAFLTTQFPDSVISVRGWVLPLESQEELPNRKYYSEDAIERLRRRDPSIDAFAPTHFHVWGNVSFDYCGWAPLFGKYSMSFSPCGPRTMCHEILHSALGLRHCTDLTDSGTTEYSRKSHCVMGKSFDGLCAAHRVKAGTLEPVEIDRGEVLLAPAELDPEDLHPNEHRAIKVGDLLLSARRSMPGVVTVQDISRVKPAYLTGLRVGEEFGGGRVRVLEESNQTFRIALGIESTVELPTGFPEAVGTAQPGIYMDARFPGHGIAVYNGRCRLFCFAEKEELGQEAPSRNWFDFLGEESEQHQLSAELLRLNLPEYGRCSFRLTQPLIEGEPLEIGNRLLWRWQDTEVGLEIGFGPHERDPMGRVIAGSDRRWWVVLGDRLIEAVGPAFRTKRPVLERDVT